MIKCPNCGSTAQVRKYKEIVSADRTERDCATLCAQKIFPMLGQVSAEKSGKVKKATSYKLLESSSWKSGYHRLTDLYKDLKMASLGSIAEASLQLGGVFQAAQAAADLYIDAAKKKAEEIEEAAHKKAAEILAQAQAHRIKGE